MLYRIAVVWTLLVTLIPATFGVVMLVDPALVSAPAAGPAELFRALALRNFAFSATLAVALAGTVSGRLPGTVVGFLLVARGLTEFADGLSGVFAVSAAASVAPFVGGLGDVLFGVWFCRRP